MGHGERILGELKTGEKVINPRADDSIDNIINLLRYFKEAGYESISVETEQDEPDEGDDEYVAYQFFMILLGIKKENWERAIRISKIKFEDKERQKTLKEFVKK